VGDAVISVLRKHHVEPELPPQRCSGTPIETYGHVDLVKDNARFNLQSLAGYDQVVTGCASCTLMLKEYKKFFENGPEQQAADALAKKVVHITEFVARSDQHPPMGTPQAQTGKVTYHSSCHLRAAGVTKEPRQLLKQLPGSDYVEMTDADRCAGGAGTYHRERLRHVAEGLRPETAEYRAERGGDGGHQLPGLHDSAQQRHARPRGGETCGAATQRRL
jgi:Fe-S oxidoreductase